MRQWQHVFMCWSIASVIVLMVSALMILLQLWSAMQIASESRDLQWYLLGFAIDCMMQLHTDHAID